MNELVIVTNSRVACVYNIFLFVTLTLVHIYKAPLYVGVCVISGYVI